MLSSTSLPVAARCHRRRTSSAARRGRWCAAIRSMRRGPSRAHTRAAGPRPPAGMAGTSLAAERARRHSAAPRATGCSCPTAVLAGRRCACPTPRPVCTASCRRTCAGEAGKRGGGRLCRSNLGSRPPTRRQAGGGGRARRASPARRARRPDGVHGGEAISCAGERLGANERAGRARRLREGIPWTVLMLPLTHAA